MDGFESEARRARGAAAPRPMVAVAVALCAGAWIGGERGAGAACACAAALAALALVPAGARARRALGAPWAAAALLALAGWRADLERARLPPARPGAPVALADHAVAGAWKPLGSRGWIEVPGRDPPGVLLHLDPAPKEGERVALLPGAQAVPWAAGPEPGPLSRAGRWRGEARVPLDLCVRLAPPGAEGALGGLARAAGERVEALRAALTRRLMVYDARAGLGGLGASLLLGRREAIGAERADLFTRTGTLHLLAVSGMNVVLVLAIVAALATRVTPRALRSGPLGGLACALAGALVLAAYALGAGAAAPVTRAAWMLALGLFAPTALGGGRRTDAWSLLAAALVIELVLHPDAPARASVSLSYLATAGLVLAPRPRARGGALQPSALGVALALARRGALAALFASLAATLATLPVMTIFGEIAPLGVLATPLCVVPVALLLAALLAGLAAPELTPAWAAAWPARALILVLELVDRLPGTPLPLPPRPGWLWALAAWGGLYAWRRGRGARAPLCAAAALCAPWAPRAERLEVVLLDVGHGTACAVRAPGLPALIVDAGSRDRPRVVGEALAPLLARWDPGPPWIVLSHDHRDHSAALEWLVERRPPALYAGALPARLGERFPHASRRVDPIRGALELSPSPDLVVRVARGVDRPGNEGSRAVECRAPGRRVVLLGDAEAEGLAGLLAHGLQQGPVDLVLLPHHGSDTPLLGALLEHLAPRRAWISAGEEPAIARELDRRGVRWRRTGGDGGQGVCWLLFR